MAKRSTVTAVVAITLVVLAALLVYTRVLRPHSPLHVSEIAVCTECAHVFKVEASVVREGAPYECPDCGQESAFLAFQCEDPECAAIFGVTPEQMEREPEIFCPVCGNRATVLHDVPEGADALARKALEEADTD